MPVKHSFQWLTALWCLLLIPTFNTYGRQPGEPGRIALRVAELQTLNTPFTRLDVFTRSARLTDERVSGTIRNYTLLDIDQAALNQVLQSRPDYIRMALPLRNGGATVILLYKVNISTNGFTLETSDGRRMSELNPVVHYRGIIENDMNSVVGFSFSREETMGLVCDNSGNHVVGELDNANGNEYVFYNDKDLLVPFTYECGTNTNNIVRDYRQEQQKNQNPGVLSTNCVDWYYEIDYDIYVGKGSSVPNVNSYIQGVFNQVATLYDNDGVSITLLTLYVWTSTDPYTGPSTSNYLNQFGAYRTSFVGDLANLIGYNGGGGVAWLDQLCGSTNYRMSYSGINSTYNTVPTYSWTVEVVTHEDGHLLGSAHTHDCVWNGNNTAIDGCGDAAGYNGSGSCATGPLPSSGTIMSYCHLVGSVGINFNNGFGPQPASRILSEVNNASCLSVCTACQPPSQPGTITGNAVYCVPSSQTYSITAVAGATSYVWSLPAGWSGSSATTSITVVQGASGGTVSVIAVNSCGNSPARTLTVSGGAAPGIPGNMSGQTTVCAGTSATYSVGTVQGATSYTWTLPSGWTGTSTTNSINVTVGSSGGTVSVAAVNSCGTSSLRSVSVTVNSVPSQPGPLSGNTVVCQNTSGNYSVAAVPGATSYTWTLPSGWTGTSTTNSITVVSGTVGGILSVNANNSCGSGLSRTLSVAISAALAKPGVIAATGGNTKVCPGDVKVYSIAAVAGASSYNWTPPPGSVITSGQGTTSVTVSYQAGFTASDSLKVVAVNNCSLSPMRFLKINRNFPVKPGVISGPGYGVCNSSAVPYSVTNVAGMTYNWSFNNGNATVANGQGTSSISVNYSPNYLNGTLSVTAGNACGTSAARTLFVASTLAAPAAMTGTTTPCANQAGVPYSITPVAGATSYTWTVPTGARINDGNVTSTTATLTTAATNVTVNFKTTAGYVRAKANNACGGGANRSLTITFSCREGSFGAAETDEFSIFPNPVSDHVAVQYNALESSGYSIRISDMAGKNHYAENGIASTGINEINLDIRSLSPGIYLVELHHNGQNSRAKIIKE